MSFYLCYSVTDFKNRIRTEIFDAKNIHCFFANDKMNLFYAE